jgi:AraC-like DNA-binding protein
LAGIADLLQNLWGAVSAVTELPTIMIEFIARRQSVEELAAKANYDSRALAKLCHLSTRQLQREFRRRFGVSPQRWLDERRLNAAGTMLLSGEPVKKVAYDLGFKQTSHFCRKFKFQHRLTPREFVFT